MGQERSYTRAAGIDLGKRGMSVCIRTQGRGGKVSVDEASYTTMASQILALRDRLEVARVQIVAMEATGDYWRPVYWILSSTLVLGGEPVFLGRLDHGARSQYVRDLAEQRLRWRRACAHRLCGDGQRGGVRGLEGRARIRRPITAGILDAA